MWCAALADTQRSGTEERGGGTGDEIQIRITTRGYRRYPVLAIMMMAAIWTGEREGERKREGERERERKRERKREKGREGERGKGVGQ